MAKRTTHKPQINSQSGSVTAVKPTVFKEPNEKIAPLGYASSVLNGNTVEGGLRSLTYKSIFASQLVDNLSAVKACITGEGEELSRISEKDWITKEKIEQLRKEVAEFKNRKDTRNHDNDEKISSFNLRLDDELNAKKEVSSHYSDELKQYYTVLYPDMNISFNNEESFRISRNVKIPVEVQRMEDVPGFDGSIYVAKAEQRKREEEEERRKQQQQQQQQTESDAAMDVESNEPLDDFTEAYVDDPLPDLSNPLGNDLPAEVNIDLPLDSNTGFNNIPMGMNASAGSPDYAGQDVNYDQNQGYGTNTEFNTTDHNFPSY
ncbi:hypothetical protein CJI97_004792 [Candidozyma auris]|nr:hypothetical protein CJI97_004792 [[Candida] auris]